MEMVSRGKGGGGETRTIYMCGQTGYYSLLVHAHTLLGRPMRPALDIAKPYPNEAPGLFFTQFYSVSRSDVCSYAWLCAHDRENIYSLSCELDGKSLYSLLSSLEAVIMCECQFMEYSARCIYLFGNVRFGNMFMFDLTLVI